MYEPERQRQDVGEDLRRVPGGERGQAERHDGHHEEQRVEDGQAPAGICTYVL